MITLDVHEYKIVFQTPDGEELILGNMGPPGPPGTPGPAGPPGPPGPPGGGEAPVIDFPVDSVNGQTDTVVLDTDDISEGTSNLYFTEARIRHNVEEEATSSYTLELADSVSKWKDCLHSEVFTLTVPPQEDVAWPVDAYIEFRQAGNGPITFTPGDGVTLNVNPNLTLVTNGIHAIAGIKRIAENEWVVFGNLVPYEAA